MCEPGNALQYRPTFESNITLHRYIGEKTEILENPIHTLRNAEH